jgi:hypothetical protein
MNMDRERWERVGNLFQQALDVEAEARSALIDTACGSDPELRGQVEALLRAHDTNVPVLDRGPSLLFQLMRDEPEAPPPAS